MKKASIFYMGEKLCEFYPHATRWQVFKFRARILFRRFMLASVALSALTLAFMMGSAGTSIQYVRGDTIDLSPQKIAQAKHHFMAELAQCESPGYKKGDEAIITDTNNKLSVGPFKFQITTMQMYYEQLYGKAITRAQAVAYSEDYDTAEAVGEYVWFVKHQGPANWVNCDDWHELQDKANIISAMEK